MSDDSMIKTIIENLDAAIAARVAKREAAGVTRDCYDNCQTAYDNCMKTAGSNLEKAVCTSSYNLCIANC